MRGFVAFAIFAPFYLFAVVDSILGFRGHHVDTKVDTKSGQRNDRIKSIRYALFFGVHAPQFTGVFQALSLNKPISSALARDSTFVAAEL